MEIPEIIAAKERRLIRARQLLAEAQGEIESLRRVNDQIGAKLDGMEMVCRAVQAGHQQSFSHGEQAVECMAHKIQRFLSGADELQEKRERGELE